MNPLAALIASLTGASAAGGRGAQQTQSSESGLFAQLLGTEGGLPVTATGETAEAGQADPAGLVAVPDGSAAGSSPVTAHFAALVAAEGETVPLAGTDAVEGVVAGAEVPAEPTPDAPEETEAETVLPDVMVLVSDGAEGTPAAPVPEQESAETDTPTDDDETPGDDGATPAVQPAPHATGLENAPQKAGDGLDIRI